MSPIYERHKYDASITNHFACPFLRMLYGSRIRQPIGGDFFYPSKLWVRLLYNFAVAYRDARLPRQTLIESMIPFYYSRMLSFVNKTIDWGTKECEDYLEEIYRVYEMEKPYLIHCWDQGKNKFLN